MAYQNQNRPPRSPSNKKGGGEEVSSDKRRRTECSTIDFTKEDAEALLNEKMKKGNPFDNKKKMDPMADLIKGLKLCLRWFKRCYIQEKEMLQTNIESAEKKCIDTSESSSLLYKRLQEYSMSLLQYNSCLQSELERANEALKRLETERAIIVENLSNVRGHNKALQHQLASLQAN